MSDDETTSQPPIFEGLLNNIDNFPYDQSEEHWATIDPSIRQKYIEHIHSFYKEYTAQFFARSEELVDQANHARQLFQRWRFVLFVLIVALAVINVAPFVVADRMEGNFVADRMEENSDRFPYIPLIAAVWTAIIAIISNIAKFFKYLEKAQSFRKARRVYLNANREFIAVWQLYVVPFGDSPIACLNVAKLYKQLIAKDREMREYVAELTDIDEDIRA